jgi:hypothetical protein
LTRNPLRATLFRISAGAAARPAIIRNVESMFGSKRSKGQDEAPYRFRVSDAMPVPNRGFLLRLRLVEGDPSVSDIKTGTLLRVTGPRGQARTIRVLDHALTAGPPSQKRLGLTGELDLVISTADGLGVDDEIDIGWEAHGPVREERS